MPDWEDDDEFKLTVLNAPNLTSTLVLGSLAAFCLSGRLGLDGSMTALAAEPDIKTPAPVIFLAHNLDEKDNLGWCIDTQGRGLSDRLLAHSCKPRGGDVQFLFVATSGQIRSATYDNKCAELLSDASSGVKLGLLDCDTASPRQNFQFDAQRGEFRADEDLGLCLSVGAASRSAGPFMSRDLQLTSCAGTDESLKRWIFKSN